MDYNSGNMGFKLKSNETVYNLYDVACRTDSNWVSFCLVWKNKAKIIKFWTEGAGMRKSYL